MKKLLLLMLLLAPCTFHLVPTVKAAGEFKTAFTSSYVVDTQGNTMVTHEIAITNQLAHIYTTEYTLAVGSDRISDVETRVQGRAVQGKVNQDGASTTMTITIEDPVIGKDQTTNIAISYLSPDIATVLGDTMTINIPRLSKANEAESFTRIIKVPVELQDVTSASHTNYGSQVVGDQRIYTFQGAPSESITMLFGDHVTYKLQLSYEISNPTLSASNTEIALPPDTPYQQIVLDKIEPEPLNITTDPDGNWLATYSLKAGEKKTIIATLFAIVSATPKWHDPSKKGTDLLEAKKYWEVDNAQIIDLAARLKTSKNIYEYLVQNFTYNYNLINSGANRQGAVKALGDPTSVLCTEFTDAFIALARSTGIPAREINGYAYSDNPSLRPLTGGTDILHAWPEYYDEDKKGWISIDPTWGNTTGGVNYFDKLDFNHIVFVRRGLESTYPLPAGVYRTQAQSKQIEVTVADQEPAPQVTSEIRGGLLYNTGNVGAVFDEVGYLPPRASAKLDRDEKATWVDGIRLFINSLLTKIQVTFDMIR